MKDIFQVMKKKQYNGELNYRIYIPDDYSDDKSYNLLIFLHGAGERGEDNELQIKYNVNILQRTVDHEAYSKECIIIAPQCPPNCQWVNTPWGNGDYRVSNVEISKPMSSLLGLIDEILEEYNINKNKIYISGISMGGYGTWYLLMTKPQLFAAGIPVCGGADSTMAENVKNIPIWTFHGDVDSAVPVSGTRTMVKALKDIGADIRYTEYPDVDHNSWVNAFNEPELLDWLFSKSK